MIRNLLRVAYAALVLGLALNATAQEPSSESEATRFQALKPRSIGPAGMSGRITAVHGLAADPETFYAGTATGGLYRTTDGGLTFEALFDDQPVQSIGAVAVHPQNPDMVWVATGEGNPRNSSSVGNGVYRSTDGGDSWTHLGLEHTEKLHRLLLDPSDQDVAYVAALGTTWGENPERGVYRTSDGGDSWELVLHVDERTGCGELVMDPSNPQKLIAGMWEHRRWPYFFRSGGPGSGLYVSQDGGDTWEQRTSEDGLPGGDLGRMGLAIAPGNPQVVYALVEAEDNVVLRSEDGGQSFQTVNRGVGVGGRPFYYAEIYVDPVDVDRVYSLESVLKVSVDGGRSWRTLAGWDVHPDHHAFWINPQDPEHLIDGNDGGLAISRNHGETWRFVRNLPLAQYYHLAVDMDVPYNVFGGMQDNGSWRGPSTVWENGGIRNHHWDEVGFGDGFATIPLPEDSQRGYAMSQGGMLMRWNNITGERKAIRPGPPEGEELRFSWNAGLAVDPFHPKAVYYGSQFVHRSDDTGDSWTVISPDLTTDNPEWQKQDESGGLTPDVTAAENFCTILAIAPSALDQGRLWVGTDDGRLWTTPDGGKTWTSVEERLTDVPRNTWIPHVEAGKHDAQTAYVVLDDHRRANREPYLFRTTDAGQSFQRVPTEGVFGHALVVEEDPVDPQLLFLGTEHGLWVTRNGGTSWFQLEGFPNTPVRALIVHPRDHDLVIGTFGRSAWVLDDMRPLRNRPEPVAEGDAESEEGADEAEPAQPNPLHLSPVPPAYQYRVKQTGASRFPAHGEYRGDTRPRGSLISFFVEDFEDRPEDAKVTILSAEGEPILRWNYTVQTGLNRTLWRFESHGLRRPGATGPTIEQFGGPEVIPGSYQVQITLGDHTVTGPLEVLADPRGVPSNEDRLAKIELLMELAQARQSYGLALERIERVKADLAQVRTLADRAKDPEAEEDAEHPHQGLLDAIEAAEEKLDEVAETLRGPEDAKGITADDHVGSDLGTLGWHAGSSWDAPTPANRAALAAAKASLKTGLEALNGALATEVAAAKKAFQDSGLTLLGELEPVEHP